MKVKDVMTRNPITIDPEASLGTAMAVMKKAGIRHLLVTDEAGHLSGIITDRDLRSAAFAPALLKHLSATAERRVRGVQQILEDLRVRDAMTWEVVTTHAEADLGHAARILFFGRIGSLPVVDGTKLVGILTERDLLRAISLLMPEHPVDVEGFLW